MALPPDHTCPLLGGCRWRRDLITHLHCFDTNHQKMKKKKKLMKTKMKKTRERRRERVVSKESTNSHRHTNKQSHTANTSVAVFCSSGGHTRTCRLTVNVDARKAFFGFHSQATLVTTCSFHHLSTLRINISYELGHPSTGAPNYTVILTTLLLQMKTF